MRSDFPWGALSIPRSAPASALKETAMKKTLTALVAAATVAGTMMGSAGTADARNGRWVGPAIVGGIIGGAIIGGAIATSRPGYAYPAYAPVEGYAPYPEYGGPVPVGCPGGYWGRRFVGYDRWGNPLYSRPRFFCPY
jgi:hypothetical protein